MRRLKYPIKAKEIAQIALNENLITPSKAKNPIISLSQVLERNIRMDMGNKPKLVFINTDKGRLIGLPEMDVNKNVKSEYEKSRENEESCLISSIEKCLPKNIIEKIELFMRIKKYSQIDDAIIDLIKRGLVASSNEILNTLKSEFDDFKND